MQEFSVQDGAWVQRVRKEVWNNESLRNFLTQTGSDKLKQKYVLGQAEGQKEARNPALNTIRDKLEHVRNMKNNKSLNDTGSTHSTIPPSPSLLIEKLIWKSKIHSKNQLERGDNACIGRLGSYSIGADRSERVGEQFKKYAINKSFQKQYGNFPYNSASQPKKQNFALPKIQDTLADQTLTHDTAYGTKERFRSNALKSGKQEMQGETQSAKRRENSHKPTKQRVLKIAGESRAAKKERFNEDAESVARSVRQDQPKKKLKYNLLGDGKTMNQEEKSMGSKATSKISKATTITQRSRALSIQLRGSMKQADVERVVDKILKQSIDATKQPSMTPRTKVDATLDPTEQVNDLKSAKGSDEQNDYADCKGQQTVITKFDAEDESAVTFMTDVSSALTSHPLSISNALTSSSKLELQLMFLAKQLETEKTRREQLQKQVDVMQEALVQHKRDAEEELAEHVKVKKLREANIKPLIEDLDDKRVTGRGGVSIQ